MKQPPIYVETFIHASIEDLWQYTQTPEIHQQWDLRFSEITPIAGDEDDGPQRFLYRTEIAFGLSVAGQGAYVGENQSEDGQRTSALKFWSDAPISLIERGSGYWQYLPTADGIHFLTLYDYQTRFGWLGQLIDRFFFRPWIGWATAWSFDSLRLWLERGLQPALVRRQWLIYLTVQLCLAAIWVYQGLVPKLLFPHVDELAILQGTGLFNGYESTILALIGVGEIGFGLLFLLFPGQKRLHWLNIIVLPVLALGALVGQPEIFIAPFNPVSLSLVTIALSIIGLQVIDNVPQAGKCLREKKESNHGTVHLPTRLGA